MRLVLKAILVLLAAPVVTVAVAWWCAVSINVYHGGYSRDLSYVFSPDLRWSGSIQRRAGGSVATVWHDRTNTTLRSFIGGPPIHEAVH